MGGSGSAVKMIGFDLGVLGTKVLFLAAPPSGGYFMAVFRGPSGLAIGKTIT